ncbi:MAG: glycosyltransferase family 4 protein, partial [Planctomycetaceae bacterium]|nr:glycosyltransferase family 4 protein [Planctomycetaceae bacterium]
MVNKRPLRIVHTESSWGWGGQEIRILTESRGMIERGHDVRIVCTPDAEIFKRAADYSVPVEAISIQKKNFKGLTAMRDWLKNNRDVDVINTHSSIDSWLVSVAARTSSRRPRIVRTRHVGLPAPCNLASNWIYRKGADFVVTCGNAIIEGLHRRNGVKRNRMRSIPTGIDTASFQPGDQLQVRQKLNLPTDRKIVGIVSALRREKGHQFLCEAITQLSRTDFDLLIVGDGLSMIHVKEFIKQHNLEERTHLVGNQNDVVPWLQAMDLFVLPSFGAVEGVPQSI